MPQRRCQPEQAVCKPLTLPGRLYTRRALTRRPALPHRQVSRVRLCHADLREGPTGPVSATRSNRQHRPPRYAILSSTGPLITDIWRTGSGHSKRFGEPLAIADSDGMPTTRPGRRTPTPPASRGIRARASLATAHRLLSWHGPVRCPPRHPVCHAACSGHAGPGEHDLDGTGRRRAWRPAARATSRIPP